MNKFKVIVGIIFGGLLLKIIHNQEVLDNHLEQNMNSGIRYDETLEYNNLRNKLRRKIYKLFNKEKYFSFIFRFIYIPFYRERRLIFVINKGQLRELVIQTNSLLDDYLKITEVQSNYKSMLLQQIQCNLKLMEDIVLA